MTSSGPRADREAGRRGQPAGARPRQRPADPRAQRPAGPLVARRDPAPRRRRGPAPAGSRFGRFVQRYGWRAYAIPLLTVATVIALLDAVTGVVTGGRATETAAASAVSPPAEPAPSTSAPETTPAAEGEGTPTEAPAPPAAATYVEQGAGTVSVVDGASGVYGTGPLQRFVVEVEDGIGVDGAQFAAAVEATLGDPRSWGAGGQRSFQRVGAAEAAGGDYEFRVSLVSPGSMETYCPGVGTGGYTSCRYGERAVINLARWETAVPDYGGDVATYRQYVVNHEVGHALGNGHEQCPGPGQLAPVMQQQTLGLQGCAKNAWPFPS
ncbi:DUF3152 domain-containing protein [Modestobacter italicus]|uniref:DUF3152 domain-containing protein n=1 Tax=Modestobacter italicus (strain DSM 44449 / CECT 9708 / BC 501) TaxID=2732864 RepID=UPI001C953C8B|nr:DUF3152 domain-containing protein [Modestobacter italicus]